MQRAFCHGGASDIIGQLSIAEQDEKKYLCSAYVLSDDNGLTYSEVPHAPVELNNGRILAVYYRRRALQHECEIMYSIWELPKRD